MNSSKILITGAAGFIGYHLCKSLLEDGYEVLGIDNLNDYYDTNLKQARLEQLKHFKSFTFNKVDIAMKLAYSEMKVEILERVNGEQCNQLIEMHMTVSYEYLRRNILHEKFNADLVLFIAKNSNDAMARDSLALSSFLKKIRSLDFIPSLEKK